MESSNAAGKPVRNIRKDTVTWRLFEHYFLMQEASAYPLRIPCETWGQALNLSVGLNRCHVQHQRETGMPDEAMLYSAKPVRNPENTEFWIEVSTNYRRQGLASPSKLARQAGGNWMENLLVQAESTLLPAPTPESTQPVPDKMESLLDTFMKGEVK
ncbi:MAG TPA: hypothetical protein PLY42_13220 [Nitrospira sp.]|nr:hypothetical protein [Nitrospira sp.]HMZ98690.1 hypothetical protein [Nitrospira sp.]HNA86015.1 hypothetical protein [Nitrospira sp.]